MIDSMVIIGANMLFWYGIYVKVDREIQKARNKKYFEKLFGGKIMFNKKEMKLVKFDAIRSYMVKGIPVYRVMLDNTIVEVTEATDIELLFFHYLRDGAFAVPRKKWNGLGDFAKQLNVGQWSFEVSHKGKDGING